MRAFLSIKRRYKMRDEEIDRITPHKAMELLKKDGIDVDIEQAKIISDFLYEMAEIVIDTYLDEQKNVNLPSCSRRVNKFNQSISKS